MGKSKFQSTCKFEINCQEASVPQSLQSLIGYKTRIGYKIMRVDTVNIKYCFLLYL